MIKTEWTNADVLDLHQLATDCVSRQAAIDALCSVCGVDCDKSEFVYGEKQEEQVILCPEHYVLTQLPSVQPERKKGKWITETINSYTKRTYCSVCNNKAPVAFVSEDYYANRAHGEINFTNYCPVCGADMRGEQE